MDNFEKLKNIVKSVGLPPADADQFIALFSQTTDADLQDLVLLLEKNPSYVLKINKNIQEKKTVLLRKNAKAWDGILKKEVEELSKLNN